MKEGQPPDPETTGNLLEQALDGDSAAEARLFEHYTPYLASLARKTGLMGALHELYGPEDVAQEVWKRCLDHELLERFEYRGRGSFAAYLGRVLDWTIRDLARQLGAAKRNPNRSVISFDEVSEDTSSPPAHDAPQSSEPTPTSHTRVHEFELQAKEILGERSWKVWLMAEREDYTSAEIGQCLGISAARVRGILMDARRKLLLGFEDD